MPVGSSEHPRVLHKNILGRSDEYLIDKNLCESHENSETIYLGQLRGGSCGIPRTTKLWTSEGNRPAWDSKEKEDYASGIIIIIIAPRLLPFRRHPAVGSGPKLEEMNPRTFPDLPICPRTLNFDQKTKKTQNSREKIKKNRKKPLLLPYIAQ